jgi:quercetin dioxygenase-like cupin family protein
MLTRRSFAACALCGAGVFLATGVEAQQAAATPGVTRRLIKQTEGPAEGYVTVEMKIEIEPDAIVARHIHPGIESSYLVEGGIELAVDGEGTRMLGPGDGFQIPPRTPHGGKNGPAKTVLVGTYVVEKGKPLASPA